MCTVHTQGMLDIALLTANASQLRYILQVHRVIMCQIFTCLTPQVGPEKHEFYTPMLVMLGTSMVLQVGRE